jgi:hypothetical protein
MQDTAKVGLHGRANQRSSVHDASDALQTPADFDIIYRCIDSWKSAENGVDRHAFLEGGVAFRIEGFWGGHASGHPQKYARIGRGGGILNSLAVDELRGPGHPGCARGESKFLQEVAPDNGLGRCGIRVEFHFASDRLELI